MTDHLARNIAAKLYNYEPTRTEQAMIYELEYIADMMVDQDDRRFDLAVDVLRRRARHIREGDPTLNPFIDDNPWVVKWYQHGPQWKTFSTRHEAEVFLMRSGPLFGNGYIESR